VSSLFRSSIVSYSVLGLILSMELVLDLGSGSGSGSGSLSILFIVRY
jgi:hypothetical protein